MTTNVWLWVWGEYFLPLFSKDVESSDYVVDFVKGSPGDVLGYETASNRVLVVLVLDIVFA